MKPYFEDSHSTLYNGDSRMALAALEPESVDCCVTSPPYWSLRSYAGIEPLLFGGREDCEHEFAVIERKGQSGGPSEKQTSNAGSWFPPSSTVTCRLCSAWRGHYGLEPTPQMYIEHSMEYLDDIWRVLKPSGTVFWNLGDSWVGSGGDHKEHHKNDAGFQGKNGHLRGGTGGKPLSSGLKPKDMALIPFRFAIAAQERGWWVRSTIIWAKNNPMPESVTDRPTDAHEYIFLLTKSARYYWNQEAVREANAAGSLERYRAGERIPSRKKLGGSARANESFLEGQVFQADGRNSRSVWTFPTQGYPEAHFATFPEELPRRCIAAGTSEKGVCPDCGKPWEQVKEPTPAYKERLAHANDRGDWYDRRETTRKRDDGTKQGKQVGGIVAEYVMLGWRPTCKHTSEPIPAVVLDLFAGSGTTLHVARKMGRRSIGVELSGKYCELIVDRIRQGVLL